MTRPVPTLAGGATPASPLDLWRAVAALQITVDPGGSAWRATWRMGRWSVEVQEPAGPGTHDT